MVGIQVRDVAYEELDALDLFVLPVGEESKSLRALDSVLPLVLAGKPQSKVHVEDHGDALDLAKAIESFSPFLPHLIIRDRDGIGLRRFAIGLRLGLLRS